MEFDERMISPNMLMGDDAEVGIRPKTMDEYVGQDNTMLYKTTTDSNGEFTIADVMIGEGEYGKYKITASMPDYYDGILPSVLVYQRNTTNVVDIKLEPYPSWDCTVNAAVNDNGTGYYSDDFCEVTWSDANSYTYYNIYRKNVETGEIELISHNKNITTKKYKKLKNVF